MRRWIVAGALSFLAYSPLVWIVTSPPTRTPPALPVSVAYDDTPTCVTWCWDTWEAEGY